MPRHPAESHHPPPGSPAAAPNRLPAILALGSLAILIAVVDITPITNNDVFLHLKTGAVILATGRVPVVDDYSALAAGRPYLAHEWLAAVLFRLIQSSFGFDGLIALKVLVALAVAGILYATARRLGASPLVAIPCLAFVMFLAAARVMERPHIFSYVLSATTLLLVARLDQGAVAPLYLLPALAALWANLHGAFLLGPGIVALSAAALLAGRARPASEALRAAMKRLLVALAMLAACLANPYGWRLLRFPFDLAGSGFMGAIYEWLPPFASPFAATTMARLYVVWIAFGAAVLLTVAGSALARRRALPPGTAFAALLFGAFLALSLRMNRNVTDFALVTCPSIAALATTLVATPRPPDGRRVAWLAPVLLALAAWFGVRGYPYSAGSRRPFGLGLGEQVPVAATDYLQGIGLHGNVFNSYPLGAYLIFRLHPDVRVAMDSRNDVYGEELYAAYDRALAGGPALQAMLDRIDAAAIMLEWPVPAAAAIGPAVASLGSWTPVYFDDRVVVYLRPDAGWGSTVRRDGYVILNPMLYRPGMLRPPEAQNALAEAERALRQHHSWIARVMKIDALVALGREADAFAEEARILKEGPRLYYIYNYLGMLRLRLGDAQKAAARFRWALELNPESQVARDGLRQAGAAL